MGLKRKRTSFSISPSSNSSSSSVAGPQEAPSPSPYNAPFWDTFDEDASMGGVEFGSGPMSNATMGGIAAYHDEDTHLHSRTRKRFRDNRPDESAIHESTISKLFLAQRSSSHSHSPPPPSSVPCAPRPSSMSSATSTRSHQASLHSFWPMPYQSSISRTVVAPPPSFAAIDNRRKCEDCDAWVGSVVGDGVDIDIDMALDEEDQGCCASCGKVVCGTCAVVEVGAGRECLDCKTGRRKKWVGGIGWVL